MQKFLISLGFVLPLSLSSPAALLATPIQLAQQQPANSYPEELVQIYMDSCVNSAVNGGVPREIATNYCRCSINRIQARYTLDQFLAIVQSRTGNQLPPQLEEIATLCVQQVGG